jgi:hypothetical protein
LQVFWRMGSAVLNIICLWSNLVCILWNDLTECLSDMTNVIVFCPIVQKRADYIFLACRLRESVGKPAIVRLCDCSAIYWQCYKEEIFFLFLQFVNEFLAYFCLLVNVIQSAIRCRVYSFA